MIRRDLRLTRLFTDALTASLGVLGALYCVITAFGLEVTMSVLVVITVLCALLFTACMLWKKALWLLLPFGAALVFCFFFLDLPGMAGPSATKLAHDILTRFSTAYPNFSFLIPAVPEGYSVTDHTVLFALAAVFLAGWLSWGVGYRSCIITIAGTLPFLLLCVVINDTPPHIVPLTMLLTVWITVLLAKHRREEPAHMTAVRMLLTLMAVGLLLAVVGTVYPKEDVRDRALPEPVQALLDRLPGPMQNALDRNSRGFRNEDLGADTGETLDLTTQGTRERKDVVMLQVSSTEPGVLYLRGAAKDVYTGTRWESRNEATAAQSVYSHTSIGTAFGENYQAAIQVENLRDKADVAFTPYGFISCPGAESIVSDLRVPCLEPEYEAYYWPGVPTMDLREKGYADPGYDGYVTETCLGLPPETKAALYELALDYGYDPSLGTLDTIAWVAEFVRTTCDYRLDVSRQPRNYDFALYFLTERKAGYCVHFATATAVMLRALEVPARYASGYRITIPEAGIVAEATDQDTHAWAEVYLQGLGWIPVESTPGFGTSVTLPEVRHEIPEGPEPSPEPESGQEPEGAPDPTPTPEVPSPSPADAPPPSEPESDGSGGGTGVAPLSFLAALLPLLLILGIAILVLRHTVILRKRQALFQSQDRNQSMIEQWAHLEQLVPWGAEIPDGMEQLALKARFSQHAITDRELQGFSLVVSRVQAETERKLTGRQRLLFKWIHCLDLK